MAEVCRSLCVPDLVRQGDKVCLCRQCVGLLCEICKQSVNSSVLFYFIQSLLQKFN